MAFGFGFGMPRSFAVPPFSPLSLFASGAPGAWYDPSDLTTLFQDSAGTTPVTAVEQPVGLMLDKSQGLVLGANLATNSFPVTYSSSGQAGTMSSAVAGTWYELTYTVTARSGVGNLYVSEIFNPWSFTTFGNTVGTYRYLLYAQDAGAGFAFYFDAGAGGSITFGSITVRQLPGNHAFQSTSASRPVLSARYNLLTKTEQFDDAAWTKGGGSITTNAIVAPDGTLTADLFTESATNERHWIVRDVNTVSANGNFVFSVAIKKKDRRYCFITLNSASGTYRYSPIFDLDTVTTVAVNTTGSPSGASNSIVALGDGWFRISASGTNGATGFTEVAFGLSNSATPSLTVSTPIYTGDGTSGNYIWGASIVPANQSSIPYQRVNTTTDYNTSGFLPYLKFDGVDDSLSTNSISFTSTDKMSVFAGVRKLSDAARAILVELSTSYGDVGTFGIDAPLSPTNKDYRFVSGGSLAAGGVATGNGFVAPITNVVTGLGNISGDLATLRVNGAQIAQGTGDQGTGNFGNYPLYIGRRGGSSLPFNGQMYSMIIVGKAVTAGELSSTETYVNQKTGAY